MLKVTQYTEYSFRCPFCLQDKIAVTSEPASSLICSCNRPLVLENGQWSIYNNPFKEGISPENDTRTPIKVDTTTIFEWRCYKCGSRQRKSFMANDVSALRCGMCKNVIEFDGDHWKPVEVKR